MDSYTDTVARWFILHVNYGYEQMAKSSLERLVTNNNLQDKIIDIKILTEKTLVETKRKKKKKDGTEEEVVKQKIVEKKLFPTYVFIKLIYSSELWFLITNTSGITGFLGPGGKPKPLSEKEARKMGLERFVDEVNFKKGDRIIVEAGALEGYDGVITELNDVTQKAKVDVVMFGKTNNVEIEYVQIRKKDDE